MRTITAQIIVAVPVAGLDAAIAVARKVAECDGQLSRGTLSTSLGMKKASGNANNRILAAQRFGLVQRSAEGTYAVTELGRACTVERPRGEDVLAAIRSVKVFASVLDKLGLNLTEADKHVIDTELSNAGLQDKSIVEGRRVLLRSLMVLAGTDRQDGGAVGREDPNFLSVHHAPKPPVPARPRPRSEAPSLEHEGTTTAFVDIPMIRGLLDAAPALGRPWSTAQQDIFIEALRHTVRFMYSDRGR